MQRRGPSFAFAVLPDLEVLLSYQGPRDPSDEEWARYLTVLDRLHRTPNDYRYLTVSAGGLPSASQQSKVKAVTHGRSPAVAIVSSSIAIRFVVSVLALVNPKVQCFRPDQLDKAYQHLNLAAAAVPRVEATLERLKAEVTRSVDAA